MDSLLEKETGLLFGSSWPELTEQYRSSVALFTKRANANAGSLPDVVRKVVIGEGNHRVRAQKQ